MKRIVWATSVAALCLVGGCISQHAVQVEPIQLQPIRVTMDVNVRIQDGDDEEAEDVPEGTSGGAVASAGSTDQASRDQTR